MLIRCDLAFKENSILTKEMLMQMNDEPKWLFLDHVSNIRYGVISGFDFIDNGMDNLSVITKGNIIIDGVWYRLNEDYVLNGDNLESGQQYDIDILKNYGEYELVVVNSGENINGIKLAEFKYEFSEHKRVFRIPKDLFNFRQVEAYLKNVDIPYYDNNGICVCPRHIAECIKNTLSKLSDRTIKEEIIFQNLLNTGNISIESLCDLAGIENKTVVSMELIERMQKLFCGRRNEAVSEEEIQIIPEEDNHLRDATSGRYSRINKTRQETIDRKCKKW